MGGYCIRTDGSFGYFVFDILTALYISSSVVEYLEFAASLLAGYLLNKNFTGSQAVNLAGLFFFGSLVVVGGFLAVGYLPIMAMFTGVAAAAAGFLYALVNLVFFSR